MSKKVSKEEKRQARLTSPLRDPHADHFHLCMKFYQDDKPEKLDERSEAFMAEIRKAAKKHGFLYQGNTQVVRHA